ncbi:lipopolysaccharide biosynthesis protein [Candidatus Omnitrophota bacterium]
MAKEEYFEKYIEKEYQEEASLGKRAVIGGIWVFALKIVSRVSELIRTIILARLLSPNDFGLMGVAMLTIGMLETFSRTGIESALIQRKNSVEECLDTAWTMLVVRSLIIFALLYFGAPVVAHFFNSPRALHIVRVLAFIELFRGAKNIGTIYFPKELRFDKGFVLDLGGLIVNLCVSIILAFRLRNVWALVYGSLSGVFTIFVMSYILQPYRPKLRFKRKEAKELLDFGKWLLGSSILGFFVVQGDDVFVGKVLGITALGFYQMAYRLSNLPATEITHVISRVTFPIYSKIQDNIPRLRDAYLKVLQLTVFLSFPLAGLIFVLAPDFTIIFLGEKWMPMVPAMQVLALFGAIRSIGATTGPLFYALGKPEILPKFQIWQLTLLVVSIFPLTMRWGILGTSISVVFAAIVPNLMVYNVVISVIKCRSYEFWKMIAFPFLAAMIAAVAVTLIRPVFAPLKGVYNFSALIVTSLMAYAFSVFIFDKLFNCDIIKTIQEYFSFDLSGRQ